MVEVVSVGLGVCSKAESCSDAQGTSPVLHVLHPTLPGAMLNAPDCLFLPLLLLLLLPLLPLLPLLLLCFGPVGWATTPPTSMSATTGARRRRQTRCRTPHFLTHTTRYRRSRLRSLGAACEGGALVAFGDMSTGLVGLGQQHLQFCSCSYNNNTSQPSN